MIRGKDCNEASCDLCLAIQTKRWLLTCDGRTDDDFMPTQRQQMGTWLTKWVCEKCGLAERDVNGVCKPCRKARDATPERRAYMKAYQSTPEYKAKRKVYNTTPERRAAARRAYDKVRRAKMSLIKGSI